MPRAFMGAGLLPDVSEKRMFKDYTLQTTQTKAIFAIAVGAVVASAISTSQANVFLPVYVDAANAFQYRSSEFLRIFILGFFLWMAFLLVFGTPAWLLAHTKGYRGWGSALVVGFFVPFLIYSGIRFSFIGNIRTNFWPVVWDSTSLAILGCFAALTIWRIAYRRPPPC